MSVRARSLKTFADKLLAQGEENVANSRVRMVATALEARCAAVNLDLAVVDTDDGLEAAVASVEYNAFALQALCRSFLDDEGAPNIIGVSTYHQYQWTREQALLLRTAVERLTIELHRKIAPLTDKRA
ncbi:hypothetical protein EDF77_1875 [Stenotrophomonas maltophilia]|nr:hypothetical protein EDF77_1875 [Stenotrophomonas maltophilia]